MPSAFDPLTSPGRMTTNVAVMSGIVPNFGSERLLLGTTKGGADLDFGTKWRAAEYDGRRHIALGTEEPIEHGPSKMTANVTEFSNKVLAITTPGATVDGDTTTPRLAGRMLTPDDYILLPWYELTLKDGTILRWEFDAGAVIDSPTINTKDKDEASMKIVIESRVDPRKPGYNSDLPDYRRIIVPAA